MRPARAVLVAITTLLLVAACSAFPFSEEILADSEAEASADVASLPMEARDDDSQSDGPTYQLHGVHAINGGKPFLINKDPVTGKVDLSGPVVPSLASASEDYAYEEEHDGIDRKDTSGTLGRPNDIGGPFKVDKTEFHDYLNLPTRYSNAGSKYPLISSSYANTKVQGTAGTSSTHNGGTSTGGGIKNHKPYSSSSTQPPHYYSIREKTQPTTESSTSTTTSTTTTTTTTTPRPRTTTTEEPSAWGLDEDYEGKPQSGKPYDYSYFNYDDDESTPPPKHPHPSEKPVLPSNSHQPPLPSSTPTPTPPTTQKTTTPVPLTTSKPTTPKVNILKPFSESVVVTPARIETTTTAKPTTSLPPVPTKTTSAPTQKPSTSPQPPAPSENELNKTKPTPEKPVTLPPPAVTKKPPTNSSNVLLLPEPTTSNKVVFGKVPSQNQSPPPPPSVLNAPPPVRPNPYGSGAAQPFRPVYENGPHDLNRRPEQPIVFQNLGRPLPPGVGDVITVPLAGDGPGSENEYVSFSFKPPSPQQLRPPPPRFPGVEPPRPNPPAPFHQPTRPPPTGFKNPAINHEKEGSGAPNGTPSTAVPSKPESPMPTVASRPVVFPDEKKDSVASDTKDVVHGTFHHNPNIPPGSRPQMIHGSAIPVSPYRDSPQPPQRAPVKGDGPIPPFRGQHVGEGPIPPFRGQPPQPPKEGLMPPFRVPPHGEKLPPPPMRGQHGPEKQPPFRGQGHPDGIMPPFRVPAQGGNLPLPPFRGQPQPDDSMPPFRGQPQPQNEGSHPPSRGQPQGSQNEGQASPPRGPTQKPQTEGELPPFRGKPTTEGHIQLPPRIHGDAQAPANPGKRPDVDDEMSSLATDLMPPADPGLNRPHLINEYPRPLWETSRPKPPHLYNGPQGLRPKLDTIPPQVYGQGPPHYKLGPRIKPNPERPLVRKPEGVRDQYSDPNLPNILPQFRPNARISNGGPVDPSRTHFVGGPQRMPLMDRPGAGRPHAIYAPPRPQMHTHLRGTRGDDTDILSDVEIGDIESLPPRSVMARRTGPHIGEPKMRVTTLQMMNYQSHRHVPKTDLSGLKPPYPAPFPSNEKPLDERAPVFVVYPVNTGPTRNRPEPEGGVVVGTRGPSQPMPPSTLNTGDDILGQVDIDDDGPLSLPFALNKQQKPLLNPSRERTDAPILKPHRDHPNSLTKANPSKTEFPYTIVQPDPETKASALNEGHRETDQDAASTGDNDSEINVIPYLQDYLPFATKKPKEAESNNAAPLAAQWASEKMDKVEQDARIVVGSGTSAPPTNIQPLKTVSSVSRPDNTGSRSPPSRHETVIGDGSGGGQFTVGAVMHTLSTHRLPGDEEKKDSPSQTTLVSHRQPDIDADSLINRDSQGFPKPYPALNNHRLPESSSSPDSQGFQAPFQASVSVGSSDLSHGWSVVSGETKSRPGAIDKADVGDNSNTTSAETDGTVVTPSTATHAGTSPFDIENFKPQLFSGFKPIFPEREESGSGQSKEKSRTESQESERSMKQS